MIHLALWLVSAAVVLAAGWFTLLGVLYVVAAMLNDVRERPQSWYLLVLLFAGIGVLYLAGVLNDAAGDDSGSVFALVLLAFTTPVAAVVAYRALNVGGRTRRASPKR